MQRENTAAFAGEILRTVIIIVVIALLVRSFIVQPFYVLGPSMEPNYHQGEYLLVDELSYHLGDPKRGDVIVLKFPRDETKDFIKRVVALPGETIKISGGAVYINGKKLDEPYVAGLPTQGDQEVKLADGEYFVMGDNRKPFGSSDSREWGTLNRRNVIGKVWLRVWPVRGFGIEHRPSYQLSILPTLPI